MAFNNQSAARNFNPNRGGDTQNDNWKADGFLNLYLPNKEGKRTKLGAIPLKSQKPNEKLMLDWLKEDPSRAAKILDALIIEFRSSEPSEGSAFALPI